MSRVTPFVGLLFDPEVVGSHDLVTAPPYDVVSDADRRRYLEASPYNVVRLDLGSEEAGAEDQYRGVAGTLRAWRDGGALVPTDGPAYFAYEMRFGLHGRPRRIRGLVCAVELEPWGGSIVPHERTMSGPIEDRLAQIRAVEGNLSCIHALFRGPSEPLAAFLDEATDGEPVAGTTDAEGVEHRLWLRPPDPEVAGWFGSSSLMIADGHHRYATALRFRDEMRRSRGPGPWDRVMMFVADVATEDPPVLPFHRIVLRGGAPTEGDRVRDLAEVLESVDDRKLLVGVVASEDGELAHRVLALDGPSPAVCALHERWLAGLDEDLRFIPDAALAEIEVREGRASAAYILPPTDAPTIWSVIDRGERLPQKSTFFWPKPRTGLVLRPFDLDAG